MGMALNRDGNAHDYSGSVTLEEPPNAEIEDKARLPPHRVLENPGDLEHPKNIRSDLLGQWVACRLPIP